MNTPICPHCGKELTPAQIASLLRSIPSQARMEASRNNGKKGGRPKGTKKKVNQS